MKKLLVISPLFLFLLTAFKAGPEIKFTEMKHNFGVINQGFVIEFDYTFTNTGDAPLIIYDAQVQCHCTVVTLPEKPVPPGQTGKVHLKFDSKSAEGRQERTIILKTNAASSPTTLVFKCNVRKKD